MYSISFPQYDETAGKYVHKYYTSKDILALLSRNTNYDHALAANQIQRIERDGIKYSGQDRDILAWAWNLIENERHSQ